MAAKSSGKSDTPAASKSGGSSAGGGGSTKDFVANLYQSTLGREADAAGLQYWSDQITKGGLSPNAVANAIAKSTEGQLAQAYQQNLGRAPDTSGMDYWKSQVASGALTIDQAINAIARSPEAQTYVPGKPTTTTPGGPTGDVITGGGFTQAELDAAIKDALAGQAAQFDAIREQMAEQQRLNQMIQSSALQTQAMQNANQGQFPATTPASAGAGLNLGAITPSAPTTTAPTTVAPAPAMYVPQTYLAPPPPQYRSVDPFASPFSSPFDLPSPFDPRRRYPFGMPYPSPFMSDQATPMSYADIAAAQVNPAAQGQTPVVGPQGMAPIPYYQGFYQQPAQPAPAPAATTPTT